MVRWIPSKQAKQTQVWASCSLDQYTFHFKKWRWNLPPRIILCLIKIRIDTFKKLEVRYPGGLFVFKDPIINFNKNKVCWCCFLHRLIFFIHCKSRLDLWYYSVTLCYSISKSYDLLINLLCDHGELPQVFVLAVHLVIFLTSWLRGIILRHFYF